MSKIEVVHDEKGRFMGTKPRPRASTPCECGDHVFVPLTKWGVTLVSPEDAYLLDERSWWMSGRGAHVYATASITSQGSSKRKIHLHRVILDAPDGADVDHEKGHTLDNRRPFIRLATRSQNNLNRHTPASSASGFRGVTLHKASGLWRGYYNRKGRQISVGYFDNPDQAAIAVDKARISVFGKDFIVTNFPMRKYAND